MTTTTAECVAEMLHTAATDRGMHITADRRVAESDAAVLLELEAASLKNLRYTQTGPAHYNRGAGNGSRISYRFDDLAAWLEKGRAEL